MYGLKGGKLNLVVFSIVLILLVTTLGITNGNALEFSNLDEVNDIGQSTECVIVVVGCDGTGSVGSSGVTIVGSNNGNNNEDNPLSPPSVSTTCEECFTLNLTPEEILLIEDDSGRTIEEICLEFASLPSLPPEIAAEELAELEQGFVEEFGVDPLRAQAVIDCLEVIFGL